MPTIQDVKSRRVIEVPGDWYAVDFHIHSPASRCFEGPEGIEDEDELYLWILERAQEANLDIIVITDHNEIAGYKKFVELRHDLRSTERTLNRGKIPIPNDIQHQIALFDQLVILPGVELDIDPNVHMLVVFDPQILLGEIDEFLTRAGYHKDIRGQDTASRYAEWSIQDVCREASNLGAIVLAAHVDSDKGLYEVSKKWGQKRAAAFTDENLFGMEFINPVSRDQITSILKNPDYARETNLAFVQSSDFHGHPNQSIGERRTYARLDDVSLEASEVFQSLKEALRNPAEYISAPGRPETKEIQERLANEPCIESLETDSDEIELCQWVCAFANSEDGTIVLGRNKKGNWIGIECEDGQSFAKRIITIVSEGVQPRPNLSIEVYPYYGDKVFATVRVRKQPQTFSTKANDRVYLVQASNIWQATTTEVVRLAEENMIGKYAHLSISDRLVTISRRLSGVRDSLDILPLVRKVEAQATPFRELFPPPVSGAILTSDLDQVIDFRYNGYPDTANAIMLEPTRPRLSNQYIRLTAPLGKCDLANPIFDGLQRFNGEKIIIGSGGAIYFDSQDDMIVVCEQSPPMICQPDVDYCGPDLRFVAAYLKSTLALWYANRCEGSIDFQNRRLLGKMLVPCEHLSEYEERVLDLVNQLVELERKFLEQEIAAIETEPGDEDKEGWEEWGEERLETIDKHNESAAQLMAHIDRVFFQVFSLTDSEVEIMQQGIKATNMKIFEV